ncbi:hypothetical protein K503DRAFT_577979 [Rhizopogon vinicolor AM-OR11-026]|uniref:Uncharacterized protein n=1 Tax=Rhizopogon vinicolor AM-OR11-026 TaxID=1314800 RepID=A0A1B7NGE3_9AGAM|nr:hypothetical protein K503DRAFT_577979 [Rhizopogon vinicolor AM-OR11-026]
MQKEEGRGISARKNPCFLMKRSNHVLLECNIDDIIGAVRSDVLTRIGVRICSVLGSLTHRSCDQFRDRHFQSCCLSSPLNGCR